MIRLSRSLLLLCLLTPLAAAPAAAFQIQREDGTPVDGASRLSEPDPTIGGSHATGQDGQQRRRIWENSTGEVTFGFQAQSASPPAFNRYGTGMFPGNNFDMTFGSGMGGRR